MRRMDKEGWARRIDGRRFWKERRAKRALLWVLVLTLGAALGAWAGSAAREPALAAALLKYGSYGEDVKLLQRRLGELGYYRGEADGIYGSGTRAAVQQFQKENGLAADGMAGDRTLAALELQEGGGGSGDGNRDNDLQLLARIISAEARGESMEGQIAVGAVVMNRVRHPTFPNTIAGVIYQPGAFSALSDGQFQQPVAESAKRAAENALNGMDNTAGAVYYYNPKKTTNRWMLSRPVLVVIGNHRFCS